MSAGHDPAITMPGFCQVIADQAAIDTGIVSLAWRWGSPAQVDGTTLAYRGTPLPTHSPDRQQDRGEGAREFVTYAHGSDAASAAKLLAEQIAAWHHAGRPRPQPRVYPAGTTDGDLAEGFRLDKWHSRIAIDFLADGSR